VLFPVRLVGFERLRDWECFDGDTRGILVMTPKVAMVLTGKPSPGIAGSDQVL